MKYWIMSDLHYGHKDKMVELCGRPEEYEHRITHSLFSIPESDTLICLGDICLGDIQYWHDAVFSRLKCKLILVRGNHDQKSYSWYMANGWDFVCESLVFRLYGVTILFTHKPTVPSRCDLNIHGHIHNREEKYTDQNLQKTQNQILIKCEHDYRPYLLETVVQKHINFHVS